MYEAFDSVPEKEMLSLPGFAADLMIAGYPIELMDGDASHVPLNWISSVLDQVIKKLGDKTFFVLSVLGIQSTGKSTLLNAMFGLQFAVSAGRCTRGAFMQMVKVKEELKQHLKFDYLLVVDTEGLRSLVKKSTLNHDNELATFVIGLGNLTLINIFGESPSDMQDVLQIAVQAFLRMKQVKLSPSCMFVHQNVGEITAGEKNMEGMRQLQKTLDEMTQLAAKQEDCDVMFFKEVIRLDFNTHIHYFAHLWEGNPPMAPPNPSYSENVQNLKQMILSDASNQNRLKISEFQTRIQDLWSALLAENFVFSFKNALEIAAYRKLEDKYGEWSWKLRSHMLDIENKLNNQVENGRSDTLEINNLELEIKEEYDNVQSEMEKYFSEDEDQKYLIQWKEKIKIKLTELKTELIEGTKRAFDELIRLKQSCLRLDEKKSEYETKLFKSSKELASKLKANGLDENKLKAEFQTLWSAWVDEVLLEKPLVSKTGIKLEVERMLSEKYSTEFVLDEKQECYQSLKETTDFTKYLSRNSYIDAKLFKIKHTIKMEDHNSVKALTQKIILDISDYIKEKKLAKVDYNSSYIHEIVNKIESEIKKFESKETKFEFKMEYKKHLCGLLCTEAAQRFEEMHCAFLQANDPLTYLISKKDQYFSVFKIFCQGAICIAVSADFVGSKLKEAILQAVYDKASIDMAGEMRSIYPAFNGNRSKLENHILISLAKKENFDEFMEYIHCHKQYFENFIAEHVDEYFLSGDNPRIHRVFKKYLKIFHSQVLDAIYRATGVVQDKSGDVPMWLDEFCKTLNNDLNLSRSDLKSVEYQDIKDINFLKEAMTKALDKSVEDLRQVFDNVGSIRLRRFRSPPHEILFKQLCGCWEKCPLCSARCTNTIPGHDGDHSVDFHRPQGISGVAWHNTDNLVTAICTSLVASNCKLNSNGKQIPYKNYREASPMHAKWSITPDKSEQPYWKWFVCHFQSDIEKKYSKKLTGEIPEQWKSIKKSAAIESLK
ncbi:Interferon-induced very large GTPase 1 [Acipenser ruthenus]|uniref:Interferon-induced very large GTPase 1 n=1 Tax=Acipenser ruthenus TaxID=7906 RepID=A0A444URT2_ACIRT|nr:Interferon-induced very large GTPase 1 [Acipenser ruthenus]